MIDYLKTYAARYLSGDFALDRDIQLKLEHSLRVGDLAARIGREEGFAPREQQLLEFAGLFHDYGRFEQLRRFKTFSDGRSCDHGKLSARLVREDRLLDDFSSVERGAVCAVLAQHNQRAMSPRLSPLARLLTGAVRDADKIDIMPILLEYVETRENPSIVWSLDPRPELSPAVEASLRKHTSPENNDFRTELDFLASKLGWAYDLATSSGRRIFHECAYLPRLRAGLPALPVVCELFDEAEAFLQADL